MYVQNRTFYLFVMTPGALYKQQVFLRLSDLPLPAENRILFDYVNRGRQTLIDQCPADSGGFPPVGAGTQHELNTIRDHVWFSIHVIIACNYHMDKVPSLRQRLS